MGFKNLFKDHKLLKKEVRLQEETRVNDRTTSAWLKLRDLKKLKLQAKDKINAIKSKF